MIDSNAKLRSIQMPFCTLPIVGKVRFVYVGCDANASYPTYKTVLIQYMA